MQQVMVRRLLRHAACCSNQFFTLFPLFSQLTSEAECRRTQHCALASFPPLAGAKPKAIHCLFIAVYSVYLQVTLVN